MCNQSVPEKSVRWKEVSLQRMSAIERSHCIKLQIVKFFESKYVVLYREIS